MQNVKLNQLFMGEMNFKLWECFDDDLDESICRLKELSVQ